MKHLRAFLLIGCVAALGVFMVPKAKANWYSENTAVTFKAPVEIPGMVLPAGTYHFRLLEPGTGNNYVEIRNANEQKVLAIVDAVPTYRVNIKDKTVISYVKRAAGAPPAIKDWFFPDRHYGEQFVYSTVKGTPTRMASNMAAPANSGTGQSATQNP
jgi:hypothetical protein